MQQISGQYSYVFKLTAGVCLQTTNDYSPFGVSLDGRTIAYQPAPAPTPAVGVIYLHKFDDGATTHPYTTAPDAIDPNLSTGVWMNNTNYWYNYTGYTGKAIAINRADYDTARLYLNFTVASGKNMDVKSFSFYHRSSSTGYSNYKLYVNNILVGSGTIYVTSNSNFLGTGTINVANPVSGLSGNVTVRLDLFGGAHGAAATFRLDNFTLNGYTQLVGAPNLLAKGYRYGYQGSEKDDELKGNGNSYTTEFRQLDPRVGRWFSIDPKMSARESPYVSMGNNPLLNNDFQGDTIRFHANMTLEQIANYKASIKVLSESKLFTYFYSVLESSKKDVLIDLNRPINTGGQHDQRDNSVTVKNVGAYIVLAQELFHAYQSDLGVYKPSDHSVVETEGDLMSVYIANEAGLGYGGILTEQSMEGGWAEKISNFPGNSLDNPTLEQVKSEEYDKLFNEAVDNRIKHFKTKLEDCQYCTGYTKPNSGQKPLAIKSVFEGVAKATQDIKQEENIQKDK